MKYYSCNLARIQIKTHKGDEKWPLFVNKQLFWWSASITLDNNKPKLHVLSSKYYCFRVIDGGKAGRLRRQ